MADTPGDVLVPYARFLERRALREGRAAEAVRVTEQRTLHAEATIVAASAPAPAAVARHPARSDYPASSEERQT